MPPVFALDDEEALTAAGQDGFTSLACVLSMGGALTSTCNEAAAGSCGERETGMEGEEVERTLLLLLEERQSAGSGDVPLRRVTNPTYMDSSESWLILAFLRLLNLWVGSSPAVSFPVDRLYS